jgi:hypothetical protein
MAYANKEDARAASQRHYRENKLEYIERSHKRKARLFEEIVLKYKQKPCIDCKNSFPSVCMDYDHVRGEKKFGISEKYDQVPLAKLIEEISKCDVVCANCHRVRTANRILALSSNGQDISLRN